MRLKRERAPKVVRDFYKRLVFLAILEFLEPKKQLEMQVTCKLCYDWHLPKLLYKVQIFNPELKALEEEQVLSAYSGHHSDYRLYPWTTIDLPKGWSKHFGSGVLRATWKDHGFGRAKGHLWARIASKQTWYKIS